MSGSDPGNRNPSPDAATEVEEDFSPVSSRGFAQSQFFAEAGVEDSIFADDQSDFEVEEMKQERHVSKRSQIRHYIVKYFIPLQLGVLVAMIWANADHESYKSFVDCHVFDLFGHNFNIHSIVDDFLMVFFFALATVEVVLSVLPGGALYPPSKAVCPVLGTIGGIIGPASVYLAWYFASPTLSNHVLKGWGVTVATDISVSWLVATFAFGSGHPAVKFLLLLAVADDVAGLIIIACFYTDSVSPAWLGLVLGGLLIALVIRQIKPLREYWLAYVILAGIPCWFGLLLAHIHPALALAPVIPFMPADLSDESNPHSAYHGRRGALTRFDGFWTLPVHIILFLFALVNAGVQVTNIGTVTWMVVVSLVLGKTLGIFIFAGFADSVLGFKLPQGMSKRHLLLVGIISGMGLTVALFIASIAFKDHLALRNEAKFGALLSLLAAPIALTISHAVKIEKRWLADN